LSHFSRRDNRWTRIVVAVAFAISITAPEHDAQSQDISRTEVVFPLRVDDAGGYLVDSAGRPFFIHGEAAWSLVVQLSLDDVDRYLADRRQRGIDALLVSLIEHHYSDNPPLNVDGDPPFDGGDSFGSLNEAYFAHVDAVLRRLLDSNMLVFLFPAYLGYEGGEEGWFGEMSALTLDRCQAYGRLLGTRYRDFPNIVWVLQKQETAVAPYVQEQRHRLY